MEKCDCFKKVPGCIRVQQPKCPFVAVIPTVTVEDNSGLKELADCFVHVLNINTTYYIDDKHRIITIWQGPVEVDSPEDVQTEEQFMEFVHSFNLRSQFLYVKFISQETPAKKMINAFYFDRAGKIYFAGEFEEVVEE